MAIVKRFAEKNEVLGFWTLKLISLLVDNDVISNEKVLNGCLSLKNDASTIIPYQLIDNFYKKIRKKLRYKKLTLFLV